MLELVVNRRSAEVILLKEHLAEGKCAFGINLIKEGLLLEDSDNDELLRPLRLVPVPQSKRVLGDTISAGRINKAQGPVLPVEPEQAKWRGCGVF